MPLLFYGNSPYYSMGLSAILWPYYSPLNRLLPPLALALALALEFYGMVWYGMVLMGSAMMVVPVQK
jgi:hypothetical protein